MPKKRTPPRSPILGFSALAETPIRLEVQRLSGTHPGIDAGLPGHSFFEMLYLRKGSGTHRVGGRDVKVGPGDLFFLGPGDVHDPDGMKGLDAFLLLFEMDALPLGLQSKGMGTLLDEVKADALHLRIDKEDRATFVRRFEDLERELADRRPGYLEAARAHLGVLLIETARLTQLVRGLVTAIPLLGDVFRVIDEKYVKPISLQDIAKSVGRSPAYLTGLVRQKTGRTVLSWIVERRMAEARRLLLETDAEVAVIAELVSYANVGTFIKLFDRLHGMTPEAWRRSRRNG